MYKKKQTNKKRHIYMYKNKIKRNKKKKKNTVFTLSIGQTGFSKYCQSSNQTSIYCLPLIQQELDLLKFKVVNGHAQILDQLYGKGVKGKCMVGKEWVSDERSSQNTIFDLITALCA